MTTRRHRIVHRTTMRYPGDVSASHNELRMIPLSEPGQTTLETRVRVRPLTWSHVYTDHWGTQVMAMESQVAHDELDIEATSLVERFEVPAEAEDVGWQAVEDEQVADRLSEYLALTRRTQASEEIVAIAGACRSEPTPRAAAIALAERIHERMTYQRGITKVQDTAAEVWAQGKGVCQDFAHVTIAGLRSISVPARYVSGYTGGGTSEPTAETVSTPGQATVPAQPGESHAWVEYWDGAWMPIDPTNLTPVGLDHIVVGRGRDYDDVAPFRGMYAGPEVSDLDVAVTVTRIT